MFDKKLSTRILSYAKKLKAINYKGGKCEKCGDITISHLCFHHIYDKLSKINELKESRWSILEKELDKCILLCKNCNNELLEKEETIYTKNKKIYLEYKNSLKCKTCGYDKSNSSLEFHHLDKNTKEFQISRAGGHAFNNINELSHRLKNELDKCEIFCSNCHSDIHTDLDFFKIYKKEIFEKFETLKELRPKMNREEIKKMYLSGMRQKDIVNHFGCSKGTISGIIKEFNLVYS